jgi:drug/metabolite transporter (DMT)-like permease
LTQRVLNIDKGIQYMLVASFLFAIMGAVAKELSLYMSSVEIVFFRNLFGLIIIGYSLIKLKPYSKGGKPFLLFLRGFIGFVALLAFFYNIANISLAEAMTFAKTAPIFTATFAYFFLKERLSVNGWIGIFIGFIGILFIIQPNIEFDKNDMLGIFSGVFAGLAYTSIRELREYYDTKVIVFSFVSIGTIGPAILMILAEFYINPTFDFMFAKFIMPNGSMWGYIILLGIFSTLAQLLMTKAYTITKAGIIGAISYSNIPFSLIVGFMLGDSLSNYYVLIGMGLVIFSGVMVAKK